MYSNISSQTERKSKRPWLLTSLLFFAIGSSGAIYLQEVGESTVALYLCMLGLPASLLSALAMLLVKKSPEE